MPEGRLGRLLHALLPGRLARDLFLPAWWEIEAEAGASGRASPWRRSGRLVLLWADCLRVGTAEALRSPGAWLPTAPDLRQGVRRLVREPGFSAVAGLTLALGVGANVAVFAVVEAVLLRPLPYEGADELVVLEHLDQRTGFTKDDIALGDFIDIRARAPALDALAGYTAGRQTLYTDEQPVQIATVSVTPGFFELLGTRPALGRAFRDADGADGAAGVAVLAHRVWRDVFGADPAVLGRSIAIGASRYEVIGVAPEGFDFPVDAGTDVFLPLSLPAVAPEDRTAGWVYALGRLSDGSDVAVLDGALAQLSAEFARDHPSQNEGSLYRALGLRDASVGDARRALTLMLGAVVLVLMVAAANVANLQLTRALARRPEMAIRSALGADRRHLVRQLLVESLVLATFATGLGLVTARAVVGLLPRIAPAAASVPGMADAHLDGTVLVFAAVLGSAVAVGFGVLAATGVRAEDARQVLAGSRSGPGRRARRWGAGLVAFEIALAVVLLLGGGLVLRSFAHLMDVDPGFAVEDVATLQIQLPPALQADPGARAAVHRRILEEVGALPDVVAVGAGAIIPLTGNNWTWPFERADRPWGPGERPPEVGWQNASGGYFEALEIPLVAGRTFIETDTESDPPPVVVSEALAERYYPGEDAVGRRVRTWGGDREIVGVVGSVRRAALEDEPRVDMYMPFGAPLQTTLFVRTLGRPAGVVPAVRRTVSGIESDVAFLEVSTMAEVRAGSIAVVRATTWLLGIFGAAALLLAAVGTYGVMSYTTRQRTAEIGTRMAMGATRGDVARLVLRQGAVIGAVGITGGLVLGLAVSRSVGMLLFEVSPADPATVATVVGVLGATTLLACWLPARRAARVAPVRSLTAG